MFEFKTLNEAKMYLAKRPDFIPYVVIKEVRYFNSLTDQIVKRWQINPKLETEKPVISFLGIRVVCKNTLRLHG